MMGVLKKTIFSIKILLLFISVSLFCVSGAYATHLVGGSVSYRYVGPVNKGNGVVYCRYEVIFYIYRDCLNGKADYDDQIDIGVYEKNGIPYSANDIVQDVQTTLYSRRNVASPNGGSKCANIPNVCLEEGQYIAYIDLAPSKYGYYFEYIRCCRNIMVNVPMNEGQTYLGDIPPTDLNNSSPYFTDIPAPYICANDTVSLLYTAYEPDGDSISYSLTRPWTGGDEFNPKPGASTNFQYPSPVTYFTGYSFNYPFGTSGYASINPTNGEIKIFANIQGNYCFAVDVFEWRNGKLISTTRRDIQIIVTSCNPNPTPARIPINNSLQSSFTINAGDKINFDLAFTDPTDSLLLTYQGDVFSAPTIAPKASLVGDFRDLKKVTASFSWQSNCNEGRNSPYVFFIKVKDNGCPPKTLNQAINIYVKPFKGGDKITGPTPGCQGLPPQKYSFNKYSPKDKVIWKISGGTIQTTNKDSLISVTWGNVSNGWLKAVEISENGCAGDTVIFNVLIYARPKVSPISGPKSGCVTKPINYSVTNHPGSTYLWTVENGSIVNPSNSNKISIVSSKMDTAIIKVVELNTNGCGSDTAILKVSVGAPIADSVYGPYSVCPNSKNIDYWVKSQAGSTYYWVVQGGVQSFGGNTSHIRVDWGNKGLGVIKVVEVTKDNCIGDTVKLNVIIDYSLHTSPIQGDTSLCEFAQGQVYQVPNSNGSSYDWKIKGGTIISGNGTARIVVDWDVATTGVISVQQSAYDDVNQKSCIGQPVLLVVQVHPVPKTSGIVGPNQVCENDVVVFRVTGFAGSTYIWHINGIKANYTKDTLPYVFRLSPTSHDTVIFDVTEISKDSCVGPTKFISVRIHRLPTTSEISGPVIVCFPHLDSAVYSVTGMATSTYKWIVDGGAIMSGDGSSQIVVNWYVSGYRDIRVNEINDFGCVGPTRKLTVKVDSLSLKMDVVTTSKNNDKVIEVHWTKFNDQFLNSYFYIFRSDASGDNKFHFIDSVAPSKTVYIDKNVQTDNHSYRYYVQAVNSCKIAIKTNIHRSILLTTSVLNDSTNQMNWNPYEGWPVNSYFLYRTLNEDTSQKIFDITKGLSSNIILSLDGYKQCYRVIATEMQNDSIISLSNKLCIDMDPHLYVPNAFTPDNHDLVNDMFRVVVTNYRSYNISIFNRWGERVFTSDTPEKMWDGTYKGVPSQEGVYLYIINVQGGKKNLYKDGTVTILR